MLRSTRSMPCSSFRQGMMTVIVSPLYIHVRENPQDSIAHLARNAIAGRHWCAFEREFTYHEQLYAGFELNSAWLPCWRLPFFAAPLRRRDSCRPRATSGGAMRRAAIEQARYYWLLLQGSHPARRQLGCIITSNGPNRGCWVYTNPSQKGKSEIPV